MGKHVPLLRVQLLCYVGHFFIDIFHAVLDHSMSLCLFKSISMKVLLKTLIVMFVYVYRSPCYQLPKFIAM